MKIKKIILGATFSSVLFVFNLQAINAATNFKNLINDNYCVISTNKLTLFKDDMLLDKKYMYTKNTVKNIKFTVLNTSTNKKGKIIYEVLDNKTYQISFIKKTEYIQNSFYNKLNKKNYKVINKKGINSYSNRSLNKKSSKLKYKKNLSVKNIYKFKNKSIFEISNGKYVSADKTNLK